MLCNLQSIKPICQQLHRQSKQLVLVTGFFDLLHQEHLNFLHKAQTIGDILIVGIESDTRAKQLKGENRPIQTQMIRATHLIPHSDYQLLLPEKFDTPELHQQLVSIIKPQVLAVSSHTQHQSEKARLVRLYGGELRVIHLHNPAISTTKILNRGILPSTNN